MKLKWEKLIAAGIASAMLIVAAGCGGSTGTSSGSGSGSGSGSAQSDKVIIGQSSWIGFAPLYIAEEKGFFKEHGADVEIQSIESKTDSKTALAAARRHAVCRAAHAVCHRP